MKNRAFTMFELIFVIVVAGIIATIAIPRLRNDGLQQAAEQIASHIRYTQHLAMQDDKFNPADADWFKRRWGITFNRTNIAACSIDSGANTSWKYSVFFDDGDLSGNLNSANEVASNPQKPNLFLSAGWGGISNADCRRVDSRLNVEQKYGITNIALQTVGNGAGNGVCGGANTLNFDELGRPMRVVSTTNGGGATRPYERLLQRDCDIVLTEFSGRTRTIRVSAQTGYVQIQ